jgi:hypothetical protein
MHHLHEILPQSKKIPIYYLNFEGLIRVFSRDPLRIFIYKKILPISWILIWFIVPFSHEWLVREITQKKNYWSLMKVFPRLPTLTGSLSIIVASAASEAVAYTIIW